MNYIFDTHCHLIDEAFVGEQETIIQNAISARVKKMILACCDNSEYAPIKTLCEQFPQNLYPTLGIHPENMHENVEEQLAEFERILEKENDRLVAIGEIGLDLYWDKSRLDDQKKVLARQLRLAEKYNLPVLLHIREAMPEFLELIHYLNNSPENQRLRGILHCYSGTIAQAEEAMQLGDFLLGVGGTVTYKKSDRLDVAKHFGLEKIVLETDSPYLAPVPHRGKRNEPAYTAEVAHFLAERLEISFEEVCEKTTENAEKLFGFH